MIYKAEYIGSTRDKFDYYTVYLFYRYRGYEYTIMFAEVSTAIRGYHDLFAYAK